MSSAFPNAGGAIQNTQGSCMMEKRLQREIRRPGPEGQVLRHVLWHVLRSALRHVLRRVLHLSVLHVLPKGSAGDGMLVLGVGCAAGR